MAAGHREAARSVLDDGEHGATLDLAEVERSYSGRRRHRARSRRPLLPTQPIRAPNATHRFSGGTISLSRHAWSWPPTDRLRPDITQTTSFLRTRIVEYQWHTIFQVRPKQIVHYVSNQICGHLAQL